MKKLVFSLLLAIAVGSNYVMAQNNGHLKLLLGKQYGSEEKLSGKTFIKKDIDQIGADFDYKLPFSPYYISLGFNKATSDNNFENNIKLEREQVRLGLRHYIPIYKKIDVLLGIGLTHNNYKFTTKFTNDERTDIENQAGGFIELGALYHINQAFHLGIHLDYSFFKDKINPLEDTGVYSKKINTNTLHSSLSIGLTF